ncbi:MAG: hypothetical protein IIA07_07480 [Proteobacteria bacterium]|nr:hypothetical protein [Pseudomonadota bacterium]
MPTMKTPALLEAAERELSNAITNTAYSDDIERWTAARQLVKCAGLCLLPVNNDPFGAVDCCESAITLGEHEYYGDEVQRAISEAVKKINEVRNAVVSDDSGD